MGCGEDPAPPPAPPTADQADPAPPFDDRAEPAEAVLALVPQQAQVVTVTDWDAVRVQLGQPDLTSEDLMTDRLEFWRRAGTESAALTGGLLRVADSRLALDYGFTQDDVDWEARFTGAQGPGFVIALRPDLPLAGVRRAVADGVGPLAGARLREADHLVVKGVADADVWANEPRCGPLVDQPATATYLRRGCLPLTEALGPDAGAEEQDALLAEHPVTTLAPLDGFVLASATTTPRSGWSPTAPTCSSGCGSGRTGRSPASPRRTSTVRRTRRRAGSATRCPGRRLRSGWRCWRSCRSRCATRSCRGRSPPGADRHRGKSPAWGQPVENYSSVIPAEAAANHRRVTLHRVVHSCGGTPGRGGGRAVSRG